ncbi:MAG: DUF4105 domain-containing protein [Alphaproteobacteria bacterium]|nr:DUF4105 domain-containing protein [Alphaproteobacteria bacterium]
MLLALLPALASDCAFSPPAGPPRVDLVSIAPGADLFSSMGHTALVFSGGALESPVAYDWGAYDQTRPDLLPAFLAGDLEYFLRGQGVEGLERFARLQGRLAVAQELDASEEAVRALFSSVRDEAGPETRAYVYHWADANCATRARDAIDALTGGALHTALDRPVDTTPRFEATRHLWRWPVWSFAWRFITSSRLDVPLTAWERTMVPEHLMREVGAVRIDGRPLVRSTCTLNDGPLGWAPARPPPTWPWVLPGLVGVAALGAAVRTGRRRVSGALVALCGLVLCALGVPSLAIWAVGDLEGVGPTECWLVAGPQSAVLVAAGAWMARGRPVPAALSALTLAVGALGLGVLAFDLRATGQVNGDIVAALLPGLLASVAAVRALGRV